MNIHLSDLSLGKGQPGPSWQVQLYVQCYPLCCPFWYVGRCMCTVYIRQFGVSRNECVRLDKNKHIQL